MKRLLFVLLLVGVVGSVAMAQAPVKTEDASNKYHYVTVATAGDTLWEASATLPSAFVVGISVGAGTASDTLIVMNGAGTVATLILPGTIANPYFLPVNARVDTSLIFIQKKTSMTTFVYRTGY